MRDVELQRFVFVCKIELDVRPGRSEMHLDVFDASEAFGFACCC
jgi:hypothetical protein